MQHKISHINNYLQGVLTLLLIFVQIGATPVLAKDTPVEGELSFGTILEFFEPLSSIVGIDPTITLSNISARDTLGATLRNNGQASCSTVSLSAIADAYIDSVFPTINYGTGINDEVVINPSSSQPKGGLFKWDLSSVPEGSIVSSASLTFNVTQASAYEFNLYALKRYWGESTVTWNKYDGTQNWGTPGAAHVEFDRSNINLWDTTPSAFGSTGLATISMNSDGVSVLQSWINDAQLNFGFTIQNYTETAGDASTSQWIVSAKELGPTSVAKLNITYCDSSATDTVIVTAYSGQSKVYGQDDPTFTYESSIPDVIFSGALSREVGENTGTYPITIGTLSAQGYDIQFVSADFTIAPQPIIIKADNTWKQYGAADPMLTYQITAGSLIGTDIFTGTLQRVTGEDIGTYAINQGTLDIIDNNLNGSNYDLTFIAGTFAIISSQSPPILPNTFYGEVYFIEGDNGPQPDDVIYAFVDGVDEPIGMDDLFLYEDQLVYRMDVRADDPNTSAKDGAHTVDTIVFIIENRVVAGAIWLSGSISPLNIHPPKADPGGPYVGLVDEPINFIGSAIDEGLDVTTYSWDLDNDGQYDDTSGPTTSWTFTSPGTKTIHLLVTDAQSGEGTNSTDVIVMSLSERQHIYDGTAKAISISGVESPYTTRVTYNGVETNPINAGEYAVVIEVKNGAAVIGSVTSTMVIQPRPITVSAVAKTKVYGDDDPTLTYSVTAGSLVSGDSFSGGLIRDAGEAVGSYPINQGDLSAGLNYYMGFVSANLEITPKPITVSANPQSKIYGENDPALSYAVTEGGLIVGDAFSGELTREAGQAIGSYAILQGSLTAGPNYNLTYVSSSFEITVRAITVTADPKSKVYSESDPELTYAITEGSLVYGDSFTGSLSRVAGEDVGEYAILQGTLMINANYAITYVENILTIVAESETIILQPGWNLVSFSLHPVDTTIREVLSSVNDNYTIVYAWDASVSSNNWLMFDPNAPDWTQTLFELDEAMGFWIYMLGGSTLTIKGTHQESTTINLSPVGGGWNLVGFPSSQVNVSPQDLKDHGFGTEAKYIIFSYVAADSSDPWKVFDSTAPAYANDLTVMKSGLGYWISVPQAVIWDVVY